MSEREVLIEIRNVRLSYGIRSGFFGKSVYTPLEDVSFEIYRGETLGVIGGNGTGKSTLLRLIAGLLEADGGRIINHGARVSLLSLGVGFAPHLSGRENAMLSGMLLGLRRKEIAAKLDAIVEFSGLGSFIDRPLHTYSSGMRARLGFSAAIQVDPDVILIDEVLGVGDAEFKEKSKAEMERLIRSDKSVVFVSHSMASIRELCDRAILLEDGRIALDGSTSDVIRRYLKQNL